MRVDGKFMDLDRNIPHGQYVSILQLFMGKPGIFGTLLMVLVGAPVPAAEVLWDSLSVTFVERTGVGGAYANRKPARSYTGSYEFKRHPNRQISFRRSRSVSTRC